PPGCDERGGGGALRDVMNVVEAVPGGRGLGVVYWEPAWTAVKGSGWDPTDPGSGNAWENQALFDYGDKARELRVPDMLTDAHVYPTVGSWRPQ
ncbi:glycosyl hydrolase 53 family protein, partial [Streptomyces sp. MCAF7]